MNAKLSFAPIQGITDFIFRNTFKKHFGGIDEYYAPYLRLDNKKEFKPSKLKDILPANNKDINLIPQIMTNNSDDFIFMSKYLNDLGYNEINWNLGCPYPMVTNRKLGAGLLPHLNTIQEILNDAIPKIKTKVSIKLRSGLTDNTELEKVLPLLNSFPLTEIIIHPRFAKQLYKEKADLELFISCMKLSKHKLCYNGDINSFENYKNYHSKFKTISSYMLGRGLISDPFLAREIKSDKILDNSNKLMRFESFHEELFNGYLEKLSDNNHVLSRMKAIWIYFSESFNDSRKVYKRIKKSTNLAKYNNAISEIFNEYSWKS